MITKIVVWTFISIAKEIFQTGSFFSFFTLLRLFLFFLLVFDEIIYIYSNMTCSTIPESQILTTNGSHTSSIFSRTSTLLSDLLHIYIKNHQTIDSKQQKYIDMLYALFTYQNIYRPQGTSHPISPKSIQRKYDTKVLSRMFYEMYDTDLQIQQHNKPIDFFGGHLYVDTGSIRDLESLFYTYESLLQRKDLFQLLYTQMKYIQKQRYLFSKLRTGNLMLHEVSDATPLSPQTT
jgi:hypothetical protein